MSWRNVAIGAFIVFVLFMTWRCEVHAADFVVRPGVSFGPRGTAPMLGLDARFPQGDRVSLVAGTMLWFGTARAAINWDWHAGFITCRGSWCASLGASYLQRTDEIEGSHTNFQLGITYRFNWWRIEGASVVHLSNLGTVSPNLGYNGAVMDIRLQ